MIYSRSIVIFIDLNILKVFDFVATIYYIIDGKVQSIKLLSKYSNNIKKNYSLIKFKVASEVKFINKSRYIIKLIF